MTKIKFLLLFSVLILASIAALNFGSSGYNIFDILNAFISGADSGLKNIIINVRIPRLLLSILVGANLAVSGVLLQSVMQNPLADPGLTGVSTGASLVALVIMLLFPDHLFWISILAFIGGTIACMAVIVISIRNGKIKPIRIILGGVAVNAFLSSFISLLFIIFSDQLQGALLWLNGSFSGRGWHHIKILFPISIIGLFLSIFSYKDANLLQLGDKVASNLGINPSVKRIKLVLIACFLTGISVANVGLISFVGLVVPHISRLIVGTNHLFLIPFSAVMGSVLMLLADTAARNLFSPFDIPVGIVTSAIGIPFFLFLLRTKEN